MKITLTKEELKAYGIEELRDAEGEEAKEKMLRLYAALKGERGLKLKEARRRVEVFACGDGGCEVFVCPAESEKAPVVHKKSGGYYLCLISDKELAQRMRAGLEAAGEEVRLFYDAGRGQRYLLSGASAESALFLEEFGRRMILDPLPYLNEHFEEEK